MDNEAQGAERALPDLHEQIDLAVGHLTVMAQSLRTGRPLLVKDAEALESAMLLLAGLQGVVSWEPTARFDSPAHVAEQLRQMAATGPRPPAVSLLLGCAAGQLLTAQRAREEAAGTGDDEDAALLLLAERAAYDLADQALAQGRRLAELQARVASR